MTWIEIPGFPKYEVSSDGKVRSVPRVSRSGGQLQGRELLQNLDEQGYPRVSLFDQDGKHYRRVVHRLLLLAFVGPCPEGMEARHIDGNPENCTLGNLEWNTRQVNIEDQLQHGKARARTACRAGHPYVDGSWYYRGGKEAEKKVRRCRICQEATMARFLAKEGDR